MVRIRFAGALAAAAGTLLGARAVEAQVTAWRQAVSGIWYLDGNWTAGIPLESSDVARIDLAGNYTVVLDVSPTISGLYKPFSGPRLEFNNHASMRITGGAFQNNGLTLLNLQGGTNSTYMQFNANTSILADSGGAGELRLNANPVNRDTAYLQTLGTAVLTNTQHHRITGTGRIYATLVNNGRVSADVPGATLELVGGDKTNNSTIEAVGGATLLFTDIEVAQSGAGVLRAASGGQVRIVGSAVRGGTVDASSSGSIQINAGSNLTFLDGVSSAGPLSIPNASFMYVDQPVWTHAGQVTVNSTSGAALTFLRFERTSTLRNAQVVLNATPANLQSADVRTWGGAVLTVDATASIVGNGQIPCSLINFGTIGSAVNQTIELLQEDKVNEGLFQTTGGTLLVRNLEITQGANGRMLAAGGEVRLWDCTVRGGRLDATGSGAVVINAGGGLTLTNNVRGSGAMSVPVGSTVFVQQPSWNHAGTVTLNTSAGNTPTKLRFEQSGALSQAIIALNANAANLDSAKLEATAGVTLTIDSSCAVSGQGRLHGNLINNAPITSASGKTIELLGGSKTNNANIRANGGTILVSSQDILQSATGALNADGGQVTLMDSTIRGGRLDATSGGVLRLPANSDLSLREGVASSGPMLVPGSSNVVIDQPAWTHAGTVTINTDAASSSFLRFNQTCALSQASIVLNAAPANRDTATLQTMGGAVIWLDSASSVRGHGRVYANLVSSGEITCTAGQTLDLLGGIKTNNGLVKTTGGDIAITGVELHQNGIGHTVAQGGRLRFTNAVVRTGFLEATGGGVAEVVDTSTLVLRDGVVSNGPLNISSGCALLIDQPVWQHTGPVTVHADSGADLAALRVDQSCTVRNAELRLNAPAGDLNGAYLYALGGAVLTIGPDATVSGRGNIFTNVPCQGALSPGVGAGGVGQINVQDGVTLESSSVAEFDLASAGSYDRITGSSLTLGGRLRVRLGSFTPQGGQAFDIVNVATRVGEFTELELPRFPEGPARFAVSYAGGVVRLTARACAPDFDADGFATGADFDSYVEAFEAGELSADVDGDGFITGPDFDQYVVAFENGC